MTDFKHTPGPWDYSAACGSCYSFHVGSINPKGDCCGIGFSKGACCDVLVADVWFDMDKKNVKEAEANARLIAKAPEMLELLMKFVYPLHIVEDGNIYKCEESTKDNVEKIKCLLEYLEEK